MIRYVVIFTTAIAFAAPAAGQGLMDLDSAWFREFEDLCRNPNPGDVSKCRGAVEQVMDGVACNMTAFCKARDAEGGAVLPVLPWRSGISTVAQQLGVCR
jgi:hypothetical protein